MIGRPVNDGCSFYLIQLNQCLHTLSSDNRSRLCFRNNVLLSKYKVMCQVYKPNTHLSSKLTNKNTHCTVYLIFTSIRGLEDKFVSQIFFKITFDILHQVCGIRHFYYPLCDLYRVRQKNLAVFKSRYIGNHVVWGYATKVSG